MWCFLFYWYDADVVFSILYGRANLLQRRADIFPRQGAAAEGSLLQHLVAREGVIRG